MPDQITVQIQGLAELQQKLAELSTTTADRCIRKALQAGAVIEQAAIRERAPVRVDDPSGTALPPGALANDIVIKMKRSDQGNLAAIVGPDKFTAHVARWAEYGHRLVRGGRSRLNTLTGKSRGSGKQVGSVRAYPFIRPAFEESREAVTAAITTTLAEEITKAGKAK
jgi:HK97 gp10 family phage protein